MPLFQEGDEFRPVRRDLRHFFPRCTQAVGASDVMRVARSVRDLGVVVHDIHGLTNLEHGALDVVAEVALEKRHVAKGLLDRRAFGTQCECMRCQCRDQRMEGGQPCGVVRFACGIRPCSSRGQTSCLTRREQCADYGRQFAGFTYQTEVLSNAPCRVAYSVQVFFAARIQYRQQTLFDRRPVKHASFTANGAHLAQVLQQSTFLGCHSNASFEYVSIGRHRAWSLDTADRDTRPPDDAVF